MSKSIKLKDNNYWDSSGITHNKRKLKDLIDGNQKAVDLNSLINTGIYYVDATSTNHPNGLPYGTLIVFYSKSGSWEYIQQFFINNYTTNENKRFAIRSCATSTKQYNWTGWVIYP